MAGWLWLWKLKLGALSLLPKARGELERKPRDDYLGARGGLVVGVIVL